MSQKSSLITASGSSSKYGGVGESAPMSYHEATTEATDFSSHPLSTQYPFPSPSSSAPYDPITMTKFNPQFLPRFLPWSYYIVYFLLTSMQELPMTSIAWIINNVTKFSPEELTIYYNLCFLPWTIKPLWGFIADNIPICGYRRKPYMIFFSWLASAVFIMLPFFAESKMIVRILGILAAWCVVFCEVQIDGLVVMHSNLLLDQQANLYKQFPEFKELIDFQSGVKKNDKKDNKQKDNKNRQLATSSSFSSTTSQDQGNVYSLLDERRSGGPIEEFDDNQPLLVNRLNGSGNDTKISDTNNSNSLSSTTLTSTSEPESETPYTSTDEIFRRKPHYYDIIQPVEFQLMITALPKATIQSEAMTFRTLSSLIASLISLVLHLFNSPRVVVWICSILPIILSFSIGLMVPEKLDSRIKAFSARLRLIKSSLLPYKEQETAEENAANAKGARKVAGGKRKNGQKGQNDQNSLATIENPYDDDDLVIDQRALIRDGAGPGVSSGSGSSSINLKAGHEETQTVSRACCSYLWRRAKLTFGAILLTWKPLLFMLLLRSVPTPTDPMMSYIFGHLTLPPWLLSAYGFISVSGGLLASVVYWKFFTRIKLIPALILFTILSATLGSFPNFVLTNSWITSKMHLQNVPTWAMVFSTTFIGAIFGRFAMMPTLILAAETSPQHFGLEATMFSIYTAMNNIGSLISTVSSVYLIRKFHITTDDFSKLSYLIVICSICSVIPLVFSPLIWCTQRQIKRLEERKRREAEEEEERAALEEAEAEAEAMITQ